MNFLHDISPGESVPDIIHIVIETPKGSQNKYEYDKEYQAIKLDRVLHSAVHYPADYGFIPQTHADDGDPLDGLVFVSNPVPPGVLVSARPIGLLRMVDQGEGDDKIIAVAADDPRYANYNDIQDLPDHVIREMENFFKTYKILEEKEVQVTGFENADMAKNAIKKAIEEYAKK